MLRTPLCHAQNPFEGLSGLQCIYAVHILYLVYPDVAESSSYKLLKCSLSMPLAASLPVWQIPVLP